MSAKKSMPLDFADRLAARVVEVLAPFAGRILVVGSVRRRRPVVNDVDIAILPRDRAAIREAMWARCVPGAGGDCEGQIAKFWTREGQYQVDLWFAKPEGGDLFDKRPTNWGTIVLCRTGSEVHNVQLAALARGKGLHWDPFRGLLRDGKIVAGDMEESIYAALGLPWREPTDREVLVSA